MQRRIVLAIAMMASLTACGGGGGSGGPAPVPQSQQRAAGSVSVLIPGLGGSATVRRAEAVVSQTAGIIVTITPDTGSPTVAGASLASGAPNCTANPSGGGRTCSVQFDAPSGHVVVGIATYDQAPTGATPNGKLLATGKTDATIVAGANNPIAITLIGVAASLKLALTPNTIPLGVAGTAKLSVSASDADGNLIVLPGGYGNPITISATDAASALSFSPNPLNGPGDVTVTYSGAAVGAYGTISAAASGVPASAVNAVQLRFSNAAVTQYVDGYARAYTFQSDSQSLIGTNNSINSFSRSLTVSASANQTFNGTSGLTMLHTNNGPSTNPGSSAPFTFISTTSDQYVQPSIAGGRLVETTFALNQLTADTRYNRVFTVLFGGAAGVGYPVRDGDSFTLDASQTQHSAFTPLPGVQNLPFFPDSSDVSFKADGSSSQITVYRSTGTGTFRQFAEQYIERADGSGSYVWIPLTNTGGPAYQIAVGAPTAGRVSLAMSALSAVPTGMPTPAPGPYAQPLPSPVATSVPAWPAPGPQAVSQITTVAAVTAWPADCPAFSVPPSFKMTLNTRQVDIAFGGFSTNTVDTYTIDGVGPVCIVTTSRSDGYDTGFNTGDLNGQAPFHTPSASPSSSQQTVTHQIMTASQFASAIARRASSAGTGMMPIAVQPLVSVSEARAALRAQAAARRAGDAR